MPTSNVKIRLSYIEGFFINESIDSKSLFDRKPWLAALMSFIVPGLGQVYAGRLWKGVILLLIPCLGLVLSYSVALVTAPSGIVPTIIFLGIPLFVLLYIFIPLDAFREARKHRNTYSLKKFNRWYVYIAIAIAGSLLHSNVIGYFRQNWLEPYVSPTGSMIPTALPGDRFYVDKRVACIISELKRGELIVFQSPKDQTICMKRLIGLPGDKIEFTDGRLKINGSRPSLGKVDSISLDPGLISDEIEFYLEHIDGSQYVVAYAKTGRPGSSSFVVPAGEVFVLGDNRDNSYDSRQYGAVPIQNIKGKPLQIWFSMEVSPLRIHWNRIGLVLK